MAESSVRNWISFDSIKKWLAKMNPIKTKAQPKQEDFLTKTLGKYEPYLFHLQNILIWDDPIISSFSILTVNVLFWIVLNFELRFYGVIFSTLLAWMCYEFWVDHVWPEISVPSETKPNVTVFSQQPSGVLSVTEISCYVDQFGNLVKQYCQRLRKQRTEQPGMFCLEVGSIFACLSMLGRSLSGPCLTYSLLMTVMVAPGVWIHVLPPNAKVRLAEAVAYVREHANTGGCELDDILPESSHENLELFQLAGQPDESDKEDSTEFAFDPDIPDMTVSSPLREDDFSLADSSSGSSANGDGIKFRGSHFDGSSDEDEEFTRGINFNTKQQQPQTQGQTQAAAALLGNIGSLLASAMSLANSRPTAPRRSSSSDLDDFEIIDPTHEKFS